VAQLPAGEKGSIGVLGGWQLMVSKYSQHPEEAAALVAFLAGREEEKRRAIEGSYSPSIESLYSDSDVLASVPFFEGFEDSLDRLVSRPSGTTGVDYIQASRIYYEAVHQILSGGDAEEVLEKAENDLGDLLGQ
jgi:trehalose/maltose transport system substrate-binding protein